MCDKLARRKGKEKVPSTATIMASHLCENCKTIHPKPWDNKCKFRATETTEEGEINNDNSENVANAQASGLPMDPQMKLYAELLATVKTLSSQVANYDIRIMNCHSLCPKSRPLKNQNMPKLQLMKRCSGAHVSMMLVVQKGLKVGEHDPRIGTRPHQGTPPRLRW